MRILTVENRPFELDNIPAIVDDIRYCILDYSDPKHIDYMFVPLVFMETFNGPAIVLNIGNKVIQMPLDWSILVCDDEFNEVDIMPLASLNDRGYHSFIYNPFANATAMSAEINIVNVYADVKWFVPKLKPNTMIAVPLETTKNPRCIFFVKETGKIPKFDISDLL